jgi:glycosyltransferase involved in cell wall biosynthesis
MTWKAIKKALMPVISIITAVLNGHHHHIVETYKSIAAQVLPEGWTWQWIVQEDGETGIPLENLPTDDPRISTGGGTRGRAATARTVALDRASGVLVSVLDADDLYADPLALQRTIVSLAAHPDLAWCVSGALDLLETGDRVPGPRDPKPGPLEPGILWDGARNNALQVMGTTFVGYTELVRALGGWPAVPASDDAGLLLAAEAVSAGIMLAEPFVLYRRWSGNTTDTAGRAVRNRVMISRAESLRRTGWRWRPPEPVAAGPEPVAPTHSGVDLLN